MQTIHTKIIRWACIVCLLLVTSQTGFSDEPVFSGETMATDKVQVVIETSLGRIVAAVNVKQAPLSANNFLRYVDGQHFNNTSFYRTVTYDNDNGSPKIEVVQGGMDTDSPPFSGIEHESTVTSSLKHLDGALSMARSEPGSASSEFFICIGDQPGLDAGAARNPDKLGFAVFGQVLEGMDVVRRIHKSAVHRASESQYTKGQMLDPRITIETIRRL